MNEGLAAMREIMGSHTEIRNMSKELISRLIKYIRSNQGGVFVLNDERELELLACYAFERKKYLNKTIAPGEGLVGQCYLKRRAIYLTKMPENYVNITSGLGMANPKCILGLKLAISRTLTP